MPIRTSGSEGKADAPAPLDPWRLLPISGIAENLIDEGAFSRDEATIPTADLAAAKNRAGRLRSTIHAFFWTAPTAADGRNEARRKDWRLSGSKTSRGDAL